MWTDIEALIVQVWNWAKANDVPNWLVFLFTAIVWPLVLTYWNRRKVNSIPHLEVRLVPGNIHIGGRPHDAVAIDVLNHTGAVAYLSGARIRSCSSLFNVPIDASRDIAANSHHLSFIDENGRYTHREFTLQTNQTARTVIAVSSPLPEPFYRYSPTWFRRLFRWRKYFVLEYTAMVGKTRYFVATLY